MKSSHPSHLATRCRFVWVGIAILGAATIIATPRTSSAAIDVKRGEPAPRIVLPDADGRTVDTARLHDRAIVVLFGASDHDKTRQAVEELQSALNEPELLGEPIQWLIVLSKSSDVRRHGLDLAHERLAPVLLHDRDRATFGDYGVVVLPSAVVIDRQGKTVWATSGLMPRFNDIVHDALRVAVGKLTYAEFDKTLEVHAAEQPTEEELRAGRLMRLAQQLAARNMHSMAVEKYREVLELSPELMPALLGLGASLAFQGEYGEAADVFIEARTLEPNSVEAALGLAAAYAHGDSSQLEAGEKIVEEVLEAHPDLPRVHYVMGLIEEARGDIAKAARQYRKAVELMLSQQRTQSSIAGHDAR